MRVVVTGCQGQVGQYLVEQLSQRTDIEAFALSRTDLDITHANSVNRVMRELNPDVIINAAAYTAVDKAEGKKSKLSYAINRDGPKHLALAAKQCSALLLHISTDYVFDGAKDIAYTEADIPNPQSVYGCSKLAGELAITQHCSDYAILRTAWVFGEHGNNFVKTMLRLGKDRPELSIIGDQLGAPTYAGDIAAALIIMMDKFTVSTESLSGIYHFSGYPYVSWYEFALAIFDAAKKHNLLTAMPIVNEVTTTQYPSLASRPANSCLNCAKVEKVFGIVPSDWPLALQNIKAFSKVI